MAADASTETRRRLALNARRVRGALGLTQEQAAERIGCSVQALQRLERATAAVTVDFVSRLAGAYAVDVAVLLAPAGAWVAPVPGRPPRPAPTRNPVGREPAPRATRRLERLGRRGGASRRAPGAAEPAQTPARPGRRQSSR